MPGTDSALQFSVVKSRLGRLDAVTNTQIYQHQSTPEIIAAMMRRHGIKDHQMSFRLRNQHSKHLFRFQYRIDDLPYIQMLMQKSGIYCYIVETEHGDQAVFGDDIDHYLYDPQLVVPYREAAGLEAGGMEAITSLRTHTVTVPQSFTWRGWTPVALKSRVQFYPHQGAVSANHAANKHYTAERHDGLCERQGATRSLLNRGRVCHLYAGGLPACGASFVDRCR